MEKPMEADVNADVCDPPSKRIRSTVSKFDINGTLLDISGINQPLTLLMNPDVSFSNCPIPEICWRGTFDVSGTNFQGVEIEAHFSRQVSYKVYETSKELHANLKFNAMPRLHAWPKIFREDSPTHQDIGLYFLSSRFERSRQNYNRLVEYIGTHDCALKSCMGDIELLIYTSKQLPEDSSSLRLNMYLWGIIRKINRKTINHNTLQHASHQSHIPSESNEFDILKDGDSMGIHGPIQVQELNDPHFSKLLCGDMARGMRFGFMPEDRKQVSHDVLPNLSRHSSSKHGNSLADSIIMRAHQVEHQQDKSCAPNCTNMVIPAIPPGFSKSPTLKQEESSPDGGTMIRKGFSKSPTLKQEESSPDGGTMIRKGFSKSPTLKQEESSPDGGTMISKVGNAIDKSCAPNCTSTFIPVAPPGFSGFSTAKQENSSSPKGATVCKVSHDRHKCDTPNSTGGFLAERKISVVKTETEDQQGTYREAEIKIAMPFKYAIKQERVEIKEERKC